MDITGGMNSSHKTRPKAQGIPPYRHLHTIAWHGLNASKLRDTKENVTWDVPRGCFKSSLLSHWTGNEKHSQRLVPLGSKQNLMTENRGLSEWQLEEIRLGISQDGPVCCSVFCLFYRAVCYHLGGLGWKCVIVCLCVCDCVCVCVIVCVFVCVRWTI